MVRAAKLHDIPANIRLDEKPDLLRINLSQTDKTGQRSQLGQYPTPPTVADFMASLFNDDKGAIRLLDPGAGVGSLTSAYIARACDHEPRPQSIAATAIEIDPDLKELLGQTLGKCGKACARAGIGFDGEACGADFIVAAVSMLESNLFGHGDKRFNAIILNPPYKKINARSEHRHLLRRVGIEATNLYTAFLALSVLLLEPDGQLVAITPRSFCNGPYFKSFRRLFLREMAIQRIHVFESRKATFAKDDILQENIIIHAIKTKEKLSRVFVSSSQGPDQEPLIRQLEPDELVKPNDPAQFIHVIANEEGSRATNLLARLSHSLADIGIQVSTGPVVDFRCKDFLRADAAPNSVPLIYPSHFADGWIKWPRLGHKKPNSCILNDHSRKWLVASDVYVVTKRFSAKEERRRIVAAVFEPSLVPCKFVAFENHLNYFHEKGRGLPLTLAKGLALYLNSTIVDVCFRQFNGHTQVNASDLRSMRFPARGELEELGRSISDRFPNPEEIDRLIESRLSKWMKNGEPPSVG
jgi:adenine-specific DNA-methyltransferase